MKGVDWKMEAPSSIMEQFSVLNILILHSLIHILKCITTYIDVNITQVFR